MPFILREQRIKMTIADHEKLIAPEEPRINPLADYDVGELKSIIFHSRIPEAVLDRCNLVLNHVRDLAITHSIPE